MRKSAPAPRARDFRSGASELSDLAGAFGVEIAEGRHSCDFEYRFFPLSATMGVHEKGLITVLGVSLVLAVLALPLMLRKVRPNVVYGVRTRATLGDRTIWYEANAHFGRRLLFASAISAAAIVVLYRAGLSPGAFLNASVAAVFVPLFVAIVATLRYVRRISNARRANPRSGVPD